MRKQAPIIEWVTVVNDADWERLRILPEPNSEPAVRRPRSLKRYSWGVAALLLLLVGAGDWWWRTTQAESHQRQGAVRPPAARQLPAVAQPDERVGVQGSLAWRYQFAREYNGLLAATQAAEPDAPLEITLNNIALHNIAIQGDQAVAEVLIYAMAGGRAHRQTRFYQRTSTGWQAVAPDENLWGPERRLETPSFIFHFRQRDAATVVVVAPQVEAFYRTMRQNLGLEHAPDGEKIIVEVSMTQNPGNALPWFGKPKQIVAPSPARYRAPLELTDSELLAQSLALSLYEHVLAQAHKHHPIPITWQPLQYALRLWQLWDQDIPLAAWREDVVRWIYSDLPTSSPEEPVVLPPRYRELCAAHTLWLLAPMQIHVPLFCTDQDQERWLFYWQEGFDPPLRLAQLAAPLDPEVALSNDIPSSSLPDQTIALATLIEYAVATYGRDRLPVLVASLDHYDTWETLIPAVYSVSAAEFEAGWQAYLAVHYGVPLPSPFGH